MSAPREEPRFNGRSLSCPGCRVALVTDGGATGCPGCGRRVVVDPARRRIDFGPFLDASASAEREKVGLAYRFYSIAYAPLAFLNMVFVWRGSLGTLVDHYRRALSTASGEVLDVAIGDAALTALVVRRLERPPPLLGLDLSEEMLVKAERTLRRLERFRSMRADACALPFPDGCFSTVCCYGGLHVIAHPDRALAEMARVLAPGGSFHASILTRPANRIARHLTRRYVELGFLSTDFTTGQVEELVSGAGLTSPEWTMNGYMALVRATKPGTQ